MAVQLIHTVSGETTYKPGSIVSFSPAEEKRLIEVGIAKEFVGEVISPIESDFEDLTPEQYQEIFNSLDKASNMEKLLAAADLVGAELSKEDRKTKKAVIDRIIEQDLDEEVLEELSKGE
ncbi:hypothetical protein [Niallia sp. 03190]|uniref:hypothetical protein n=1 Tax=Niallia sp. 03190 TaxID=3458061 RepID=UPI0040442838